jgi:chromatin remodeling complex protein RSC6
MTDIDENQKHQNENQHLHLFQSFEKMSNTLSLMRAQMNLLQKEMKELEKNIKKEIKTAQKQVKTKPSKKRSPSGFAKPTKVTKELCEFMNKPAGTEIARTEVTKALVQYIKDNKLQEKNNESKNKIVPDEKLYVLLGITNDEANELTFFNIQKYMNKHFKPMSLENA